MSPVCHPIGVLNLVGGRVCVCLFVCVSIVRLISNPKEYINWDVELAP